LLPRDLEDESLRCEILTRDNDGKYTVAFDEVFKSTDCQVKPITPESPNLQAHVERVIQTLKHEVLNGFCVVSNQHLDFILRTAADWYNHRRSHSARDHLPPVRDDEEPETIDLTEQTIVCHKKLGGLLKSYHAAA
jgi:putative transposase